MDNKVLKVCLNDNCDAVAHNCPKKETHCRDCDAILVEINESTYRSKYINNYFQYNYDNDELVKPTQMSYSMQTQLF